MPKFYIEVETNDDFDADTVHQEIDMALEYLDNDIEILGVEPANGE